MKTFVSIVVPIYNEANSIHELLTRIHNSLSNNNSPYEVIFIDDNSTDNPKQFIDKFDKHTQIYIYTKQGRKGKAFSLIEGFAKAKGGLVVMLDGDLQYPPESIPAMCKALETSDIAVASRNQYTDSRVRKILSNSFKKFFGNVLFGLHHDIQSGMKAFKRQVLETIKFEPKSPWTFDLEFLHRAKQAGFTIKNVETDFARRINDFSKVGFIATTMEIGIHALLLRVKKIHAVSIAPKEIGSMLGAGMGYKKNKYITHTTISHHKSAIVTFTKSQKIILTLSALGMLIGLALYPLTVVQVIVAVLSFIYFVDVLFNLYLIMKSLSFPQEIVSSQEEINNIDEKKLPIYSILCPLYREAHVLPQFLEAIGKISWPKDKLDVLLLLEEDDKSTIEAIKLMSMPSYVRILVVPHSLPKTKPKACNYGLAHAKGEYLVVFDAEDMPDPLQLKKAYLGFQKVGKEVICLQAKLNYYNPNQNLLTRFFTAEYSLWFDVTLTGLQSINTIIPLGGTSNHFKTQSLHDIEGWDPFNVTEDADLGVRLFKKGYKTAIIDSVTLEEANSRVGNWLRQRSRWIKGYMQTYLVHVRESLSGDKMSGRHSLLFQLIIGGKIAFLFINPFLWLATIAYFGLYAYVGPQIEALYPSVVFYMAITSLIFGNFLFLYYYMIGVAKKGQWSLMKFVLFIPLYWLLISVAATVGLFQLIFKPHYWEKTVHGLHLIQKENVHPKTLDAVISRLETSNEKAEKKVESKVAGVVLIFATLTAYVLNFLTNLYLGKTTSIEQFSLVSLMGSFFFISVIFLGPLASTMAHQSAYMHGKFGEVAVEFWKKIKKTTMYLAMTVTLIWLLSVNYLAVFFNSENIVPFVFFAPVWIIGAMISLDRGFMLGNQLYGMTAFIVVFEAVIKLLLSFLFIQLGFSDLVYAAMPLSLLATFLTLTITTRHFTSKITPQVYTKLRFPKKFFITSLITGAATLAFLSIDLILAKHYLSVEEAGSFALLAFTGKIIFFIGTVFSQFIIPSVSRKKGESKDTLVGFYKIYLGIFVASALGYFILGVNASFSLPLLFGQKAQLIIPLSNEYGLAMLFLTLANALVIYHQARKEYLHSIMSLCIVPALIFGIMFSHHNLDVFIHVLFTICISYFFATLTLHVFYGLVTDILSNIRVFLDLLLGRHDGAPHVSKNLNLNSQKIQPLKILIFNWRDTQHVWAGGAEVYLHNLSKQWIAQGHFVTLFCGNDSKHSRNQIIDGVEIIRRGGFFTVYIWAFLYYVLKFRNQFDVVIDSQNGVPFFTPLFVRVPKVLLIHHVHQEVFSEHLSKPMAAVARFIEGKAMPFVYRGIKNVTVSNSSKLDMIKLGLGSEQSISIISPGVEIDALSKMKKTQSPTFVYLGRLKEYKNIDTIIRAFALVEAKYPTTKLVIAGMGEELSALQGLVNKLNLSQKVEFTKYISEKRKSILLATSWAALQPSGIEGFGITVLEANASGTPVIASRVSGLLDSVVDEKTGLFSTLKNPASFARQMTRIIENDTLRNNLSSGAHSWAHQFSWKRSANLFLEVLQELVDDINAKQNRNYAVLKVSKI